MCPAVTHEVVPATGSVTTHVSLLAQPHCGASPQRWFGRASSHGSGSEFPSSSGGAGEEEEGEGDALFEGVSAGATTSVDESLVDDGTSREHEDAAAMAIAFSTKTINATILDSFTTKA